MKNKNLIWGLFFILAGVALILDRTGLLGSVSVWSVVISLLLVPVIVTSVRHLNFWGIFFPMAIMAILFDETLGIEKFTPWPLLLCRPLRRGGGMASFKGALSFA
jgi:cytochrome c oxidase subunit IV